jgi:hypothetical protein
MARVVLAGLVVITAQLFTALPVFAGIASRGFISFQSRRSSGVGTYISCQLSHRKSGPLQGAAFLYDKAVAAIAPVACDKPKDAAQIGDAILAALERDRYWHDARLRNGAQRRFPRPNQRRRAISFAIFPQHSSP